VPESLRIEGYVSFDPSLTEVELDGERLVAAEHQTVRFDGTDRGLTLREK